MAKLLGGFYKGFKGCWKRAGWQFRSPIETGCSASEMSDSSFEAQQKHCQMASPTETLPTETVRGASGSPMAKLLGGF